MQTVYNRSIEQSKAIVPRENWLTKHRKPSLLLQTFTAPQQPNNPPVSRNNRVKWVPRKYRAKLPHSKPTVERSARTQGY